MPLTSLSKLHKTFPQSFADDVKQHVRRRVEEYKAGTDTWHGTTSSSDQSVVFPKCIDKSRTQSRAPLSPLIETSESDVSPRTKEQSPRPKPSGPPKSITTARGRRRKLQSQTQACAKNKLSLSMTVPSTPRVTRLPVHPTSVSLDDVDLWESDGEHDDSESSRGSDATDDTDTSLTLGKKALSYSASRCPTSTLRESRENSERFPSNPQTKPKHSNTLPMQKLDSCKRLPLFRPRKQKDFKSVVPAPAKSEHRPVKHTHTNSRDSEIRRTYCMTTSPEPPVTSRGQGKVTQSLDGRNSKSPVTMEMTDESPREASKRTIKKISKSPVPMETVDGSPRDAKSPREGCVRTWCSRRAMKSPVPMETYDENSQEAKKMDLRSSIERGKIKSPSPMEEIESNIDSPDLSNNPPSRFTSTPSLSAFRALRRRGIKTPTPMDTELHCTAGSQPKTHAHRKVKFNNLVQVHDGDSGSVGLLRSSSVNTAQMFKNKYLARNGSYHDDDGNNQDNQDRSSPCQVQLAY